MDNAKKLTKENYSKNNLNKHIKLLDEKQATKLWIRSLLAIRPILPELIKAVDKIVEAQASSLSFISDIYNKEKSTYAQFEKVIDLSERKNKLLNIYFISKHLTDCLDEFDKIFIEQKYISNLTAEELADEYKTSVRTIFRKAEKLLDKIYDYTVQKKWTLQFLKSQLKDEKWIHEHFTRFAKETFGLGVTTDKELQ